MMLNVAILIFSVLFINCASTHRVENQKFDAPLKQKLAEIEKQESGEVVQVFVKCSRSIDEDMRSALEKTGVTVESVLGDVFTGSGSAKQIRRLSKLDFVTQINLSTTSKPLY
ncbi:MAG: hypothetical protein Kow0042_11700 [Calditrichia bacterium]